MKTIRVVITVGGAEVAEGYGASRREALADAHSNMGQMDTIMAQALGEEIEFHTEEE